MASIPLHQTPLGNNMPPEGNRVGTIPLSQLMDFIIQKTYDELIVLADTIGSQTDMDKKKTLFNYTTKTRQLFVRLLALVKWVNNVSKVNKSSKAIAFLDQQSQIFMETADQLSRLSRETLIHARLPAFQIPAAVEVLTTGSFSRLPMCIKDKIVPHDPITTAEEKTTLQRLSQVILHRLVTGNLLPQMRDIKVEAGKVTIRVHKEFSICLTVMGDGPDVPWRLLDLEILVSDRETGNGSSLVHPLQTRYIHQLVQSRLLESPNSLSDAYYILHNFCQSLQLEVLYSQTLRLMQGRLDNCIHVNKYKPGDHLTISYWRELTMKDPKSKLGYKLTVHMDLNDPAEPLAVVHIPSLGSKECQLAITSEKLSIEYLLVHTIHIRTKTRLLELKQELQNMLKDVECTMAGSPATLSVVILQPCLRSEQLLITIDTYTGMLQCHVPQYNVPLVPELSAALNGDRSRLIALISELRFWITQRRCEKTLEHLPVAVLDKFPIIFEPNHPMAANSKRRMFIQFLQHLSYLLIVEFKEKELSPCEIEFKFYLAVLKPCAMDDNPHNKDQNIDTNIPKMFFKIETLEELDSFVISHGPFTSIETDSFRKEFKRPSSGPSGRTDVSCTSQSKRIKNPAYFIPELAHVVAFCSKRIVFIKLAEEFSQRNIAHQGLQIDTDASSLVLKLIQLPSPSLNPNIITAWQSIIKRLLSVSIRISEEATKSEKWMVEFVFYNSPLKSSNAKEQGSRRPVYFQYKIGKTETASKIIDSIFNNWAQIVYLYSIVEDFAEYLNIEKYNLKNMVNIKSYNYNKLILDYGPNYNFTVFIYWSANDKSFKVNFGKRIGDISASAHSLIKQQLEDHLNHHNNLAQLIHILNETLEPLISISKLPTIYQVGILCSTPLLPIQIFTIIPQSTTLVRIVYQETYCLELKFRGSGFVTIRDGAYSRFDVSNVVNEFTPIQGLKTFLSKYVDETATFGRYSLSEDDNPPSPVSMDTNRTGGFMSQNRNGSQSPAQRDGLRFHTPSTPPSVGNPHTPASPYTMNMQGNQYQNFTNSPATSYNLTSPPSLPPNTSNLVPHPSPGSGFVANSPMNSMHAPSPAGHIDSSPFPSQSMTSPAASNWPGSPMARPSPVRPGQSPGHAVLPSPFPDHKVGSHVSRVLPQRSWAGAVPTFLTHQAFDLLCTPSIHPTGLPGVHLSPLERFFGCINMRRQLQRFIQSEDNVTSLNAEEPGAVYFKIDTLQCHVALNPQHLQSLHMKIQPIPEYRDKWSGEELQILETFFDIRVVSPPYRPNGLFTFCKILTFPLNILKDFIQIMKLELNNNVQQHQFKWSVKWCLTVPPCVTPNFRPIGSPAIMFKKYTVFFLKITRIVMDSQSEPTSLILPLYYESETNRTLLVEKRDADPKTTLSAISMHLKKFVEYTQLQECSIFPAVRNILMNFMLPSELPVTTQVVTSQPVVPITNGQVISSQQVRSPAMQVPSPINASQGQPPGPYVVPNMPARGTVGRPPQ